MSKFFDKRIEADKKKFAENEERLKEKYPKEYKALMYFKAKANEIKEKEGFSASLRFIVNVFANGDFESFINEMEETV